MCAWESHSMCVCVCERDLRNHLPLPPTAADIFGGGKESLVTQQGSMWAFIYETHLLALKIIIHIRIQCLTEVNWRSLGFSRQTVSVMFLLSSRELLLPPYLTGLIYKSRILVPDHLLFQFASVGFPLYYPPQGSTFRGTHSNTETLSIEALGI